MQTLNLEFIKSRRLLLNYTQQDMADAMGFKSAATYNKLETGNQHWRADQLPILARILRCKISDFFTQNVSKSETKLKQEVS